LKRGWEGHALENEGTRFVERVFLKAVRIANRNRVRRTTSSREGCSLWGVVHGSNKRLPPAAMSKVNLERWWQAN